MTKVRLLALLAVVALVLFPAIAFAQGAPQLPCAFHGTVQVNGANVADGTVITATIGNETKTTTTTDSAYRIVIEQPEGKNYDGVTVAFKIGSDTVGQTGTWQMGGNVAVNLTKGTGPITPGGSVINGVQLGNTTSYDPVTGILTIKKADITGPKGDTGATGPAGATGATGPAGKGASSVIGIIAIVLAVIAIIIAGVAMLRPRRA